MALNKKNKEIKLWQWDTPPCLRLLVALTEGTSLFARAMSQ